MTGQDALRRITEALNRAGIPHMVTGSFASSYHGVPRASQDIDIVIAASAEQLRAFVRSLSPGEFYASEDAAVEARRHESQFYVIDLDSGWKMDLILRKTREFSRVEFDRRSPEQIHGVPIDIASPEDVVIAKLEWAKRGSSERQIEDAAGILKVKGRDLDRGYVEEWVSTLGFERQWEAARRTAGEAWRRGSGVPSPTRRSRRWNATSSASPRWRSASVPSARLRSSSSSDSGRGMTAPPCADPASVAGKAHRRLRHRTLLPRFAISGLS